MSRDKLDIQPFLDRGYTLKGDVLVPPQNVIDKKKITELLTATHISPHAKIPSQNESVLVIEGLIAGLNGSKGLMRSHWTGIKKQKTLYQQIIQQHFSENKIRKHTGEVSVEYIGYKSSFMDWDNFCASFKHVGDSLVKMKIIKDDSPKIITQFIPSQIKCSRAEQKVIIIIKDK
jgi:hypothetical protein